MESSTSVETNLKELKEMISDVKDSIQVKSLNPIVN